MPAFVSILASVVALNGIALKPADFLDGRAIADGTGAPVVMLTLAPKAAAKLKALGPKAAVTLDGKPATVRLGDNTIEIDGQTDFPSAEKLALAISGKPPLPDSLDE